MKRGRKKSDIPSKAINRFKGKRRRLSIARKNFNDIENREDAINIIASIASSAGRNAASRAKASHLPLIYARGTQVILETADGNKKVVATAQKQYFKKYVPGTVMHVANK